MLFNVVKYLSPWIKLQFSWQLWAIFHCYASSVSYFWWCPIFWCTIFLVPYFLGCSIFPPPLNVCLCSISKLNTIFLHTQKFSFKSWTLLKTRNFFWKFQLFWWYVFLLYSSNANGSSYFKVWHFMLIFWTI